MKACTQWRSVVAGVLTIQLVLTAAACGRGAETHPATQQLSWSDCGDGFECSTLTVPRDWDDQSGPTIEIAVIRLPATAKEAKGSVLVNWGGPGAPGLTAIRGDGAAVRDATGGQYDIVSWDPRGLNKSEPFLCPEGNAEFYSADPTTPEGQATMAAAVKLRADACSARYGDYLGLIGTTQGVHDLDALRAALGQSKINYLGLSYGTRIGSVYAAMFPDRIRTMVLDGSLAPLSTLESTVRGDAAAFEAALHEWFRRCGANPPCAFGPDPEAGFDALVADVRANPPLVPGTNERLTVGLLYQVFLAGIVNFHGTAALAEQLIADYVATGDPTNLFRGAQSVSGRQPDGTYNNATEIFQFVNCQDWFDRPTPPQVVALADEVKASAPRMGPFGVTFAFMGSTACPDPPRATPIPTSTALPPILVVASTVDAQTPLPWGQQMSASLPNSRLLVSQQFGHTSFHTSHCVAQLAGEYLASGTLPTPGTICPPE